MKLLLVDDHPLFSFGFAHALSQADPTIQVQTAATLEQAFELAAQDPELDMALIDYRLGSTSGIELLRGFGSRFPWLARVLISGEETAELMATARAAGASGFIGKSAGLPSLLQALRAVAEGGVSFDLASPAAVAVPSGVRTTLRQREVLALVAAGQPNKRIARELGIAERTVKLHITGLMSNLGARNRTHLVAVARERALL